MLVNCCILTNNFTYGMLYNFKQHFFFLAITNTRPELINNTSDFNQLWSTLTREYFTSTLRQSVCATCVFFFSLWARMSQQLNGDLIFFSFAALAHVKVKHSWHFSPLSLSDTNLRQIWSSTSLDQMQLVRIAGSPTKNGAVVSQFQLLDQSDVTNFIYKYILNAFLNFTQMSNPFRCDSVWLPAVLVTDVRCQLVRRGHGSQQHFKRRQTFFGIGIFFVLGVWRWI